MMEAILLNVQKTLHILILLHNLEPKLLHIVIFYYTSVLWILFSKVLWIINYSTNNYPFQIKQLDC